MTHIDRELECLSESITAARTSTTSTSNSEPHAATRAIRFPGHHRCRGRNVRSGRDRDHCMGGDRIDGHHQVGDDEVGDRNHVGRK
jgi:hypothetical protein